MISHLANTLALRNRALSVVVATTGSATLAATATGFTRATGSFLTDGFSVGMDVVTSGFTNAANNGNGVVVGVTATTLTVSMYVVTITNGAQSVTRPATVIEASASGRTIAAKLPSMRAFENVDLIPAAGIPYVEEDYAPATHTLIAGPRQGGIAEETGLYMLKLYGPTNVGVGALRKLADALAALFAGGTILTSGAGAVRIRGDVAPVPAQILPQGNGWSVLPLSVYWLANSSNTIAA